MYEQSSVMGYDVVQTGIYRRRYTTLNMEISNLFRNVRKKYTNKIPCTIFIINCEEFVSYGTMYMFGLI
jgi:hypothetical protein